MRVAFYAPLKPPDHPVPSGDRQVARSMLEALRRAGHQPFVASRLRSFDRVGDAPRQARLAAAGGRRADRLIGRWRAAPAEAPRLWLTYHLYYKAPDWLGPAVSAGLHIPYVIAEASSAPKRARGPWAAGHRAVERAIGGADAIIGLNPADRAAVLPLLASRDRWIAMPPLIDATAYQAPPRRATGPPRLIAVAMMRPGDKLASYRVLGAALARLADLPWSLDIVGDGPVRPEVEAALAPIGSRVRYFGECGQTTVRARLAAADLFVWPAINEAFGMALLEAQASGVPVVAGASGGVGAIVEDGVTGRLVPTGDPGAFAEAVRALLGDPEARQRMGAAACDKMRREHDIATAARRLAALLSTFDRACAA